MSSPGIANLESKFQSELVQGEQIVWTGQPSQALFAPADVFLVPFTLMWGGFAIFWEASVLGIGSDQERGPPVMFPLFGAFLVAMGLYIMFGRFFYKAWRNKRTYYAVTNQRVMILTDGVTRKLQAVFIKNLPSITKRIGSNGVGTLRFGNNTGLAGMAPAYENTGMDFFAGLQVGEPAPSISLGSRRRGRVSVGCGPTAGVSFASGPAPRGRAPWELRPHERTGRLAGQSRSAMISSDDNLPVPIYDIH